MELKLSNGHGLFQSKFVATIFVKFLVGNFLFLFLPIFFIFSAQMSEDEEETAEVVSYREVTVIFYMKSEEIGKVAKTKPLHAHIHKNPASLSSHSSSSLFSYGIFRSGNLYFFEK